MAADPRMACPARDGAPGDPCFRCDRPAEVEITVNGSLMGVYCDVHEAECLLELRVAGPCGPVTIRHLGEVST